MLQYVKRPRNIAEFTLMKGVTDFSNLKQFDLYETSYGQLVICSVPKFMDLLCARTPVLKDCQDTLIHVMEGDFKGIDGLPDIVGEAATITNGVNELMLINNVTMDTSIQVSMNYYERSGSPLTKYIKTYLNCLKDPYSKAKTYGGLIADGTITDPGSDYEVFTLLYFVTDNTCRKIEMAYLLANAQFTMAPMATLYNAQRGDIQFPEIQLTMNAFPIIGDEVNLLAAKYLEYTLTTSNSDRLVLDSTDFNWYALNKNGPVHGGYSLITDKVKGISNSTIANKYNT